MRFVSILLSAVLVVFLFSTSSILAQTEDIVIEAEGFDPTISDAIADSTMWVYDDAAASNGKYLMIRKGGKKKKYVGYKFSTTSTTDTTYFLWVKSRPNYGNSTYDRQYINWDVPAELVVPGGGGGFPFQGVSHVWFHNDNASGDTLVWRWRLTSENGPTIKLNLQPGEHTFFIRSRDSSGSYDMIKITNDTTWRPDIMFEFEAESGAVTAPLFTDFFEGASNDSVVATTPGSGTVGQMDLMNGNDDIGVHMDQAPDDFYIWLLVDLPSEDANSYWIGVNDEQVVPPSWEGAATTGLEWRRLTDANGDARVYDLPVEAWNAPHILRVKQQEEGTRIDKVLVTNDPDYVPGGGGEPVIEDIVIEAEDFDPTISDAITDSTMWVYDDATASNGKYLAVQRGGKRKKYVGYKFTTTSATDTTYFLWIRSHTRVGGFDFDRQYINWDVPEELVVPGGGGGFPFQGVSHLWFHNDNASGDTLVWRWRLTSANGPTIKLNLQPGEHTFFIRSRDGNGAYDMIKITNDTTWRPDIMFEFEAESGAVTAPLVVEYLEGASKDSVVATTPGSGTVGQMDLMNGNDDIGVHMDQAPDDFYIWLLVDLPSESANSYWIGVNDEQVVPPSWEGAVTNGLEWRRLTDASGDARVYDLPVEAWNAPHILRVKQQEEGTRIDKVLVTNDPSYEPIFTGVEVYDWESQAIARTFEIQQNYPNPFNPSTNIAFYVPESGQVVVSVYNILGQKIVTLLDKKLTAGKNAVIWDARDQAGATVSSGVYFYQIQFNDQVKTAKMILMQ